MLGLVGRFGLHTLHILQTLHILHVLHILHFMHILHILHILHIMLDHPSQQRSIHSIFNKGVTSSFNKVVSELVTWVDYDRTWV